MKSILLIVAVMALSGCKATPQIRITEDGMGLQVVVCPETGECFIVSALLVPDGWEVRGEAFASPANAFE